MKYEEIWSVNAYDGRQTYEWCFLDEAQAWLAYRKLVAGRQRNLLSRLWRLAVVEVVDDFNVTMAVEPQIMIGFKINRLSEHHRRAVDVKDTQTEMAERYQ